MKTERIYDFIFFSRRFRHTVHCLALSVESSTNQCDHPVKISTPVNILCTMRNRTLSTTEVNTYKWENATCLGSHSYHRFCIIHPINKYLKDCQVQILSKYCPNIVQRDNNISGCALFKSIRDGSIAIQLVPTILLHNR